MRTFRACSFRGLSGLLRLLFCLLLRGRRLLLHVERI